MNKAELAAITGRKLPDRLTVAALELVAESLRLGEFIEYVLGLTAFAHENYGAYRSSYFANQSDVRKYVVSIQGEMAFTKNLSFEYHEEFVCEMIVQRTADNFVKYLTDLLTAIFVTRPQSLRTSKEQESLDFVLGFESMEELIRAIAEKRVEQLAYLGMRKLDDYFREKLGFELFVSASDKKTAERLIEVRNVIVHNRGRVSKIYKSRIADEPKAVGERIDLKYSDVQKARLFLENLAVDIDQRAVEKWGLPTLPEQQEQTKSPAE
jgi:hypothetical protein